MNTKGLFMSQRDNWETPQALFDELDSKYHFNLDPCADDTNHKCDLYFTEEDNGLAKNWGGYRAFVNPPYGRKIGAWIEKCYLESKKPNTTVVALLPARTDTKWFHNWIYGKAEIEFIKGRLKFGGCKNPAPFPSMIVKW